MSLIRNGKFWRRFTVPLGTVFRRFVPAARRLPEIAKQPRLAAFWILSARRAHATLVMVVFAAGAILHDTSSVIRDFPEDRYVAASLQLFASVALLFWYVLRLFMSRD